MLLRRGLALRRGGGATLLLLAWAAETAAVTSLSSWQQGIGTNYGGAADGLSPDQPSFGTMDGSCGYGVLDKGAWPFWQCFEIQCLNQGGSYPGRCNTNNPVSVIIQVTDKCPECMANQIDIQALTFNKLAPMAIGRIDIQFRRVECVPPAPMVVFVDNNNGPGSWLRLFIEQSGGQAAVASVQVRTSGGGATWQSMRNVFGSDWEVPQSPAYPLDISISGPDGQTVTAFSVINSTGQIGDFPTSAQFHITNPTENLLSYPVGASGGSGQPAAPAPPGGASGPPAAVQPQAPPPPTTLPVQQAPPSPPVTTLPPPASAEALTPTPLQTPPAAQTVSPPPAVPEAVQPPPPSAPVPPPPPTALPANRNPCGSCFDHSTPVFSCEQQVGWGQCQQPWMLAGDQTAPEGFCALSCGRCTCP